MFLNERLIRKSLKWLKSEYWNAFNLILAIFSKPTIKSPIDFSGEYSFHLREYKIPRKKNNVEKKLICSSYLSGKQSHKNINKTERKYHYRNVTKFTMFDRKNKIRKSTGFMIKRKVRRISLKRKSDL